MSLGIEETVKQIIENLDKESEPLRTHIKEITEEVQRQKEEYLRKFIRSCWLKTQLRKELLAHYLFWKEGIPEIKIPKEKKSSLNYRLLFCLSAIDPELKSLFFRV